VWNTSIFPLVGIRDLFGWISAGVGCSISQGLSDWRKGGSFFLRGLGFSSLKKGRCESFRPAGLLRWRTFGHIFSARWKGFLLGKSWENYSYAGLVSGAVLRGFLLALGISSWSFPVAQQFSTIDGASGRLAVCYTGRF
jgi:hypothetical protein